MTEKEKWKKVRKRHTAVEWLSLAAIYLLFIVGIAGTLLLQDLTRYTFLMVVGGLILIFALLPFVLDIEFYLALWKAMREGKEVLFKAETKGPLFSSSLLGAKEIWIRE